MNLKCKIKSNIKIFIFFIIGVAIDLVKIILKIMDEFQEKNRFIVDFWNDDTMFVTHTKWKMWIQKLS
jgi:hypothetical protein